MNTPPTSPHHHPTPDPYGPALYTLQIAPHHTPGMWWSYPPYTDMYTPPADGWKVCGYGTREGRSITRTVREMGIPTPTDIKAESRGGTRGIAEEEEEEGGIVVARSHALHYTALLFSALTTTSQKRRASTVAEVADMLAVSPRTVRRLLDECELSGWKIRGAVRVDLDSVDDYLRANPY